MLTIDSGASNGDNHANMVSKLLRWLVAGLLKLRYRVKVKGFESLSAAAEQGILFLPNHPAEIDPAILASVLWKKFRIHPLVVENFYYMKGLHWLFKFVGAIPIPDVNGSLNSWKQRKMDKAHQEIEKRLQAGEHFLIYPAGRLKQGAEEIVGGASMVHTLVQNCSGVKVVLIRTTGLWGSRFSRALTGSTPDFKKTIWEGVKIVLKNGLFFVPKRKVVIEMEVAPADFPVHADRLEFNHYLEAWYNRPAPEPLTFVSELFWKEKIPQVIQRNLEEQQKNWSLPREVEEEIFTKIGALAHRSDIQKTEHLERDLGLDSLDLAQLVTFLEGQFEIGLEPGDLQTVEDVLKAVALKKPKAASPTSRVTWPVKKDRPPVLPPRGATLQEAFLNSCRRMGSHTACADAMRGPISYRRLKMIAVILSRKLVQIPQDRVGILLPSSAMTYALIFALLLAKKTPVMLNWTMGPRALDHCRTLAGLKTILSSRRFLDQLSNADLGEIDDNLLLLEDVKVSMIDKLLAWFPPTIEPPSEDDPAVILFTSGTEALPKGVPLSHRNLLSNHSAALACVNLLPDDVFYGVLPPFHSFGFSVTGILPILVGLKVYYAPDPTHYHGMAQDIEQWKVSFFCSAPTFILGVMRVANPKQLTSLRYIVAGAEKAPEELFKAGIGEVLEGYGITECAPVVTLNRPGFPREGVGLPLPGIELCIVDPATHVRLTSGKEGEICIQGPNLFSGYLNSSINPFLELGGRRWYLSGDLGYLTPQGALILSGRLKRFVKIGGEMVSLGGLEHDLLELAQEKGWIPENFEKKPPLAVVASEKEGEKSLLFLFVTFPLTKQQLKEALLEKKKGGLVKIAEVRLIDQIPVTGTGKIQYHKLYETL